MSRTVRIQAKWVSKQGGRASGVCKGVTPQRIPKSMTKWLEEGKDSDDTKVDEDMIQERSTAELLQGLGMALTVNTITPFNGTSEGDWKKAGHMEQSKVHLAVRNASDGRWEADMGIGEGEGDFDGNQREDDR